MQTLKSTSETMRRFAEEIVSNAEDNENAIVAEAIYEAAASIVEAIDRNTAVQERVIERMEVAAAAVDILTAGENG